MNQVTPIPQDPSAVLAAELPEDSQIWESLKQAIAESSGFQRWQQEQDLDEKLSSDLTPSLDRQVQCYLRETLETLAY
ncbi:MAG: hypothetical protein ACFBSC_04835 [Microcoleaceae cyanobacterium]